MRRYHELDWLRVLLIFAVFVHHVCMPFNGDYWHVMNNESSKLLDEIMLYFEQFRLPILFLISGAGSVILLSKKSSTTYLLERGKRLLVPFLVAMVLLVPLETYIENINNYDSYWQAYPSLVLQFELHHLWFIEFLIVFAIFAIPLKKVLESETGYNLLTTLQKLSVRPYGLFLLVFVLAGLRITLKSYFPEWGKVIENPSESVFYLFFYIAGIFFFSNLYIWHSIQAHRRVNLYLMITCSLIFYGYYYAPDLSPYLSQEVRNNIWWVTTSLLAWSATLAIMGYAQYYLSVSNQWLTKCNELIYPFYIFHHTVIVVLGYYIIQWPVTTGIKVTGLFVLSLSITVAICLFVVYPFTPVRILFGLKPKKRVVK